MRSPGFVLAAAPAALIAVAIGAFAAARAPIAQTEGIVQKIMYVHVPSAFTGYIGAFVGFVASIGFLATKRRSFDRVAVAATEVALLFLTLVLVTGPIWAKPAWGIWWRWDARLTMTFVLWLLYVSYLVVRGLAPDKGSGARWSAVVSVVAALVIPIVHYSVQWWATLHPLPKVLASEGLNRGLAPEMAKALWLCVLAFGLAWLSLFLLRLSIERLSDRVEGGNAEEVSV